MQLTYDDEDNQFSLICDHPDHEDQEITTFIEMPNGLEGIELAYNVAKFIDQPGLGLFSDLEATLEKADWDGLKGNIEKAIDYYRDLLDTVHDDHNNKGMTTDIFTMLNESFTECLDGAQKHLVSAPEKVIESLTLNHINLYYVDSAFQGSAIFMLPGIDFPMVSVSFILKGFNLDKAKAMMARNTKPVLH